MIRHIQDKLVTDEFIKDVFYAGFQSAEDFAKLVSLVSSK